MTGLLDQHGRTLDPAQYGRPRSKKPIVMNGGFGQWAGRDIIHGQLPGGGVMQFDLSKLTLSDFRSMRQHYQIGASINVLGFILHQIDWSIESDNEEARTQIEEDIRKNWTLLIRSMAQAFWAGFSPIAVNYKNGDKYVEIDEFRDLIPEECNVNWQKYKGWAPPGKVKPTMYRYDGFWQGSSWIRPQNSMWYPLLMENGNHYGRKLLANAFPSWYFSQLMHLFANRYFERFGEPMPVGRAPFDDQVDTGGGNYITGRQAMEGIVSNIRNRSVSVLPSDRDPLSGNYDYDIEYLESQMRGADFERYLNRLDEEMSLSVFTPVLLFRTADVGSYNLGQAHLRIFQQMLNAIAADMQFYIQNYLVDRLVAINWPGLKDEVRWTFRTQGQGDVDTYKELMTEMVRQERAIPDLKELSLITGIEWEKAEIIAAPPEAPDPIEDDDKAENQRKAKRKLAVASKNVAGDAAARTARQYASGASILTLSHRKRMEEAMAADGWTANDATAAAGHVYGRVNAWLADASTAGMGADDMKGCIENLLVSELEQVA